MKFIKKILLLSIFLISNINVIFASSNILINNTDKKELEINEKYDEKLNITVNDIKIEDISNNNIKITGNINIIQDINNNNVIVPYNIKKSTNETYNLNDVYIMAFSSIKTNINVYWHREITDNKNIGKGYIKDNENIIIDREYGTGDDKTIQNEEIYTNNELINKITETNLLNSISIDKNNTNVIFEIIIDKNKITKMRYLYITTINDIIKNNNNITYKNLLSDYIDLFEYYDAFKNIEIVNTSATNNQLFGETPVTANYTFYKAAETLIKQQQDNRNSSFSGQVNSEFWYNKNNGFYIKDENQNKATPSVIQLKMTQDDDNFCFNVNIDYKSDVPCNNETSIGNNEYQKMNNGTLYLSNEPINNLSYNYTITYPSSATTLDWHAYYNHFSSYYTESINNNGYNGVYRQDSLNININGCSGNQSMKLYKGGTYSYNGNTSVTNNSLVNTYTPTNNVDTANSPSLKHCSYVFPFESYLNGTARHTPLSNMALNGIANLGSYDNYGHFSTEINPVIDTIIQNKILFTNSQVNSLIPKKPSYTTIENISINKDTTNSNWNNKINSKITIKKSDINNYRYLNMYAPDGVVKSKSNSWWSYNTNYSDITHGTKYTWTSPEAKLVAYSIHSSEAIDLLPYSNCEHNWVIGDIIDENQHYAYCTKCEWKHKVNHNFEYEYDGLDNNLCACGFNHRINHHYIFNSDLVSDYDEVILASSSYIKNNNPIKTGYKFKSFDKYLKYFENMSNPVFSVASTSIVDTYIGEVASMSEISDRFTTTYKANYEPIKYYVHFNANNNMNLPVDLTGISNLTCYYDNKYNPPIISSAGYTFKGWTLASGSNVVNVSKHGKIENLTANENQIIDVYPVFDVLSYTFIFSTQSNINKINITQNIEDLICYKDIHYNLSNNIDVIGYIFKGWSLTKYSNTIDFEPNAELYNYTNIEDQEYSIYPVYEPIKYKFIFSNNNIKNLLLNNNINAEEYVYDIKKNLPNSINIRGYSFKGWSLVATSSNIDFEPNAEILNYTTINNQEYTLYPVYEGLKFVITYTTTEGNYSNNNKVLSKNYTTDNNYNLEMPYISARITYNSNGVIIKQEEAIFKGYTGENNKTFKTFAEIQEYIINKKIDNYVLVLNYNFEYQKIGSSSNSSGGDSGSGGKIIQDITQPKQNTENINIKNITIRANNKNIKTIKKETKISKKDLIDLINEVYSDFKDQNGIKDNEITIYINDIPYNNEYDIVSFVNEIFNDVLDNLDNSKIFIEEDENNYEKDMVYSFTSTEFIKSTKSNIKIAERIGTYSNIKREISIDKSKATESNIKINRYISKIFTNNNDYISINEIIDICNKRQFLELFNNFNNNKYGHLINDFIKRYDGLFEIIEKEIKKSKYEPLHNKLIDIINGEEYSDLKSKIVNISYKYGKEYVNLIKDIKNKRIKKIVSELNAGKHKNLIGELLPIITDKKITKNVEYELIDGEYSDLAYDIIYYLFETTYNYEPIEKETIQETTKETEPTTIIVEATKSEVIIEENIETNNFDILLLALVGIVLIGLIITTIFIIKKKSKKDEM